MSMLSTRKYWNAQPSTHSETHCTLLQSRLDSDRALQSWPLPCTAECDSSCARNLYRRDMRAAEDCIITYSTNDLLSATVFHSGNYTLFSWWSTKSSAISS